LEGEDKLVPELLQDQMNARQIYKEVMHYINNPDYTDEVCRQLEDARKHLGEKKPSEEVARVLLETLYQNTSQENV
jgi:lipid A disaccharide synthetase